MVRSARKWLAAGALAAAALLGSTERLAAQAARTDPPAVAYRKAVMDVLVAQVVALRLLLGNEIAHEGDTRRHTASLLANAMMFDGLFPAGSAGATSNARDEIWGNSEEFRAHMKTFQDAARTLDQEVARNQGRTVTMPRLQMVIETCGSCHATFKLPAPLPF